MSHMPRERLVAWLFVAPATLLIAVFVLWPSLSMLRTSVQTRGDGFVTAAHYRAVLGDPQFRRSAVNTTLFAILVVPLQTALALALALWTNRPGGATRILRAAVFIPTTISLTVLSILWALMYAPASLTGAGLLNGLLKSLALPTQPFLTSTRQALPAIVAMSIWQGVGLQMLILLAGLQQIPQQLYEAAELDGAGRWRRFLHVTCPGIAPITVFVVMVTTIFALKLFVQPYLMTGGGPEDATISTVQYIYTAFKHGDLSLACAAGVIFTLAVLLVAAAQRYLFRRAETLQ